jgi:hypothetical protein
MRRLPETKGGKVVDARDEHKSMRRTDKQFFVRCEIEIPLADKRDAKPLGFICWIKIAHDDYERLLRFRKDEKREPAPTEWIEGTLANPVSGVDESHGTAVKFEVVKGDPTPYVKWVAPRTALARRIAAGAASAFWHEAASLVGAIG